jgi:calcium-dependent protein kinase
MQKLKHPNIVELYEVIYTQNNIYLIMEYCAGGDLKRFCMTRKINEDMALNIVRQVARGFEELSKFGIIHRDLKAANILVHQEAFKICDFGFAKFFGDSGKMARTCVGTPIYMSPQVLKHKQYTSKTDVWSLGILFFELLFGRLPYNGYSEDDLYRNIIKGPLAIPECSK